jgi:hypothetical protein
MRKAAGVIMIILGWIVLGINVFVLWMYGSDRIDLLGIFMFGWTIFAFIGGILCLMRRYWGVCIASAIAAVVLGIFGLPLVAGGWGIPGVVAGIVGFPLVLAGGIASTVFISRRKKEWQEIFA